MDGSVGRAWRWYWLGGVLLPVALVVCVIAVLWRVSSPERQDRATDPAWAVLTAVDEDDISAVRRALERGTPVDVCEFGCTPLMRAAELGRTQIVELLLSRGASTERADAFGTALAYAAWNSKSPETVRLLLRRGADPNVGRPNGRTPLILATSAGNVGCMAALIEGGASLDTRDNGGESALDVARAMGHADAERLLLTAIAASADTNSHTARHEVATRPGRRDGVADHFQPLELHRTASGS